MLKKTYVSWKRDDCRQQTGHMDPKVYNRKFVLNSCFYFNGNGTKTKSVIMFLMIYLKIFKNLNLFSYVLMFSARK